MKLFRLTIIGILSVTLASGCSDFLEETSQDEVIPTTAEDYSELLLNYMGYSGFWSALNVLSDELRINDEYFYGDEDDSNAVGYRSIFTWQPDMWETEGVLATSGYEETYAQIMGVNAVLDGIDDTEGAQETKDYVKAEALGLRGFYYLFLVNMFGEPYNYNKEAPGVPLKLTSALVENGIARSTVEEVYEQIVEDLENSSELFSHHSKHRGDYRINSTSVEILLSRTYLYMERWNDAISAATRAIESAEGLTDYTTLPVDLTDSVLTADEEFRMASYNHSEVEWLYSSVNVSTTFAPSDSLLAYFKGKEDRRENFWLFQSRVVKTNPAGSEPRNTIRISEAYLNRAEAYVLSEQADKLTRALADLNELRRHRIVGYEDVSITDETELLEEIRRERYVELFVDGHRWFDLRRYGMPSIVHEFKSRTTAPWEIYVLREKDPLYTVPLPRVVFESNLLLEQNSSANEPERTQSSN